MKSSKILVLLLGALLLPAGLHAQPPATGSVTGTVIETPHAPLENASVALRSRSDSTHVLQTITGRNGGFVFDHVPTGTYVVECSLIGHAIFRSPPFTLDDANPSRSLGEIVLKPTALLLKEMVVSSKKSLLNNAIDRRVYNVDQDVMAKSSTASDLLQNIPSVQVDIDGNVSLRGSSDVMILVNGKKSPLIGKNRADVLQQLPASGIERIEVITNPSARYTPEGTSGIINIVMKDTAAPGLSGDLTGHVGAAGRHNENFTLGGHPGKLDLFGSYSYRDDRRTRNGTDDRALTGVGSAASYVETNRILMRPHVHMGNAGLTWHATAKDAFELSGEYFRRQPSRDGVSTIVTRDAGGTILTDYDRRQTGSEFEREAGVTTSFEHDFAKEGHQLRIELNGSDTPQKEPAHFVDHWVAPVQPDAASDVVLSQSEKQAHLTIDYAGPLGDDAKLEAGYALEFDRQDIHSDADSLDVAHQVFVPDPTRTYRFRLDQAIHAVYGTYERSLGRLSVLGGLRGEYANVKSDLVTGSPGFDDRYAGLYPTLHFKYKIGKQDEAQLSYSRRIRRPESDDLNPFPEFTDPYNMDAGNPRLRPESTHSIELGYRLPAEHFSFVPSVYYRDKTNAFTRVTTALTDTTFLRTFVNLASDRSAGFEPVLTISAGRALQANLNANVFWEEIDASNLGFVGRKSVVSWSGTGNVSTSPWSATEFEATAVYRSGRLTPQGQSRASFGLNVGARQNLSRAHLTLTVAVTDLLKTQRQETELDVAGIQQRVKNLRDSRIVYAGLTWHYGRAEKSDKEKPLPYEESP